MKEIMEQDNWGAMKLLSDVVYNYTPNHGDTREVVEVRVVYGSDVRLVRNLLLEKPKNQKGVLGRSEPFIPLDGFCELVLGFGIFFSNDSFVDLEIKSELRYEIEERLRIHNTRIPLPQREINNYDEPNLLIPIENE